jgi:hypothetical protein
METFLTEFSQMVLIGIALGLLSLGITIAIIQYLIRYGMNYYFKMKAMNDPNHPYSNR